MKIVIIGLNITCT